MRISRLIGLATLVAGLSFATTATSQAQISVHIGPEPACPYGYYDYAPYPCAPYGYYGPEWFNGGVFIGAGPWFHGPREFHGHVDNHFDAHHGYHGPMPQRGEHAVPHEHAQFHGNEMRDGRGHADAGHR
jgi:hypothetical protein